MAKRPRKIALIGITAGSDRDENLRWDCFGWETTTKNLNLHDYDVWVLNASSFARDFRESFVSEESIYELLSLSYVQKALANYTSIYVIGDPRFTVRHRGYASPFLSWTGSDFDWNPLSGDTLELDGKHATEGLIQYLSHMRHWQYALQEVSRSASYQLAPLVQKLLQLGKDLTFCRYTIASNRVGEAIAFKLVLSLYKRNEYSDDRTLEKSYGSITFVPLISGDEQSSVQEFLKCVLKISIGEQEPEWAARIEAPGQPAVDSEIAQLEEQLHRVESSLEECDRRRKELRKPVGRYYETGLPLEDTVRRALAALGATIEPPTEPNKEDGWIAVRVGSDAKEGVLEIKSTGKPQFSEEGIRQLSEWITRGKLLRHKSYRGIFIGNSAIEIEPCNRENPFSDSWVKAARLIPITAMTTATLFRAYELFSAGMLDEEAFWSKVFSTDGVVTSEMFAGEPEQQDKNRAASHAKRAAATKKSAAADRHA